MAALVAFRNKSGVTAKNVTATIEFAAGIDSQTVFHGCWLDETFSGVWIEASMTKHLVVAVHTEEENDYDTCDCQRHEINDEYEKPIVRGLGRQLQRVTVTLGINGEDKKFCFVLDLSKEFRFDSTPCEEDPPSPSPTRLS